MLLHPNRDFVKKLHLGFLSMLNPCCSSSFSTRSKLSLLRLLMKYFLNLNSLSELVLKTTTSVLYVLLTLLISLVIYCTYITTELWSHHGSHECSSSREATVLTVREANEPDCSRWFADHNRCSSVCLYRGAVADGEQWWRLTIGDHVSVVLAINDLHLAGVWDAGVTYLSNWILPEQILLYFYILARRSIINPSFMHIF